MGELQKTYCAQCKRLVYRAWVGGKHPANFDTEPVSAIELARGTETFLLQDGNTVRGERVRSDVRGAKTAYPQHKTVCVKAPVYTGMRRNHSNLRKKVKEQVAQEKKEQAEKDARAEEKAAAERKRREAEAAQLSFFGNREV